MSHLTHVCHITQITHACRCHTHELHTHTAHTHTCFVLRAFLALTCAVYQLALRHVHVCVHRAPYIHGRVCRAHTSSAAIRPERHPQEACSAGHAWCSRVGAVKPGFELLSGRRMSERRAQGARLRGPESQRAGAGTPSQGCPALSTCPRHGHRPRVLPAVTRRPDPPGLDLGGRHLLQLLSAHTHMCVMTHVTHT